jgi:L-malate glycosyltransferase
MKISFFYNLAYPFSKGGAEKRIYDFAKYLSSCFEVEIVSSKCWIGKDLCSLNGLDYRGICRKIEIYNKAGKRKIIPSLLFGIKTFFFVLKTDSDILDFEVFPYFPIMFAKLALFFKRKETKIIANWCECLGKDGWKNYDSSFWFVGLFLEKLAKSSCDKYLAISEFTKNRMVKNLGIDEKKIEVIHPCIIDYEKIEKINSPEKKEYDIIYFGRLIGHKHVEKIIKLSEQFKNNGIEIKSLVIGNGPEEEILKCMVSNSDLMNNVDFLDFIDDYDKLIQKIKSAKIMILPSEREGFGIAVLEANACDVPVLVLDYPDNASKELICNGKNGFICKDEEELYEKTKYLLENNMRCDLKSDLIDPKRILNFYANV